MNTLCVFTSPKQPNSLAMTFARLLGAAASAAVGAPPGVRRALADIDSVRRKLASPDRLTTVSAGTYVLWREKGLGPEYKLVLQPKLPQFAIIFGLHVSRSSFTWESGIYVRSDR